MSCNSSALGQSTHLSSLLMYVEPESHHQCVLCVLLWVKEICWNVWRNTGNWSKKKMGMSQGEALCKSWGDSTEQEMTQHANPGTPRALAWTECYPEPSDTLNSAPLWNCPTSSRMFWARNISLPPWTFVSFQGHFFTAALRDGESLATLLSRVEITLSTTWTIYPQCQQPPCEKTCPGPQKRKVKVETGRASFYSSELSKLRLK